MAPAPITAVDISFYGLVRGLCSQPHVTVDVPSGVSARALLERLATREGDGFRQRLTTGKGTLQPGVQVFVDGQRLHSLDECLPEAPTTRVKILILTATAGG